MSEELEQRLIEALADVEKNKGPFWKKPGFWVSWLTVVSMICGGMFWVLNMVLQDKFEQWSKDSSPYAVEKELTGVSLHTLAAADQRHDQALDTIKSKLGEISRKLDKQSGTN